MSGRDRLWGLVWVVLSAICAGEPAAQQPGQRAEDRASPGTPKRVFILHSYEREHVCGRPQHKGVLKALRKAGFVPRRNMKLEVFHMDTKKHNNTPALIAKVAERAIEAVRAFAPDVLVTLDDNAFRTVGLKFVDTEMAVVFSGMNGQPEDYHKRRPCIRSRQRPGHNVTGVYEYLHLADALRVHRKIFPGWSKARLIVDRSPTGKALRRQMELELNERGAEARGACEIVVVEDWEQYQAAVQAANQDQEVGVIYPVALLLKDQQGKTFTAPSILRWTAENSTKPELALNYYFTRLGLFGGAAVDFEAMGMQTGALVAKILRGARPGELAIENAKGFALSFNLRRARALGIEVPKVVLLAAKEIVK